MPLNPVPDFPASLDSLPDPTATTYTDDDGFELDLLLQKHNAILETIEAILGAGITAQLGVMRKIAEVTLGASAAQIDFTSIPQGYRNLRLTLQAINATAVANVLMRLGTGGSIDTGSNYDYQFTATNATSVVGGEALGATSILAGRCGVSPVGPISTIEIVNYAGTSLNKAVLANYTGKDGTSSGNLNIVLVGGHWRNSGAIDTIRLFPAANNFGIDTRATLYGLPT